MNNENQYIEPVEPEYTSDIMQDINQIIIGGCGSTLCWWLGALSMLQPVFWLLMIGVGVGGLWSAKKLLDLLNIDLTNREVSDADGKKT